MTEQREQALLALYERVLGRVCAQWAAEDEAEAGESRTALAGDVEERWRARLQCYTGYVGLVSVEPMVMAVTAAATAAHAASTQAAGGDGDNGPDHGQVPEPEIPTGDRPIRSIDDDNDDHDGHDDDEYDDDVGTRQPQPTTTPLTPLPGPRADPASAPSSVFARMLGRRRRLDQLDGTSVTRDEDKEVDDQDDGGDGGNSGRGPAGARATAVEAGAAAARPSMLFPVTSLRVSDFPAQCAAEDVSFRHSSRRRGYVGKWRAAIVTLTRPVGSYELLSTGSIVWCDAQEARGLVEVVDDDGIGDTLLVATAPAQHERSPSPSSPGNPPLRRVQRADVRRFHELVVEKAAVHFCTF